MSDPIHWIWSAEHQRYYYVTHDHNGQPVTRWGNQSTQSNQTDDAETGAQQNPQGQTYAEHQQPQVYQTFGQTSPSQPDPRQYGQLEPQQPQPHPYGGYQSQAAVMPPPIPPNIRERLPGLIPGTPDRGWYERLDPSYRMRTGYEAHQFFKKGQVFAMLWAEAASETDARTLNPDGTVRSFREPRPGYTRGRFGQSVYSTIRRFVVVNVKRDGNFVYACPISTYTRRGATKRGCNPSEHTIVYFQGTTPQYFANEYALGMTKEPIEILPAEAGDTMDPTSRLRFGKTFPIEWNVKVKDIGKVHPAHIPKLLQYWRDEMYNSNETDDEDPEEGEPDEVAVEDGE